MAKRKLDGVDGVALSASTNRGKQTAGKAKQTSNKPAPSNSNGNIQKKAHGSPQKKQKTVAENTVFESAAVQLGEDVDSANIQIITGSYEKTLHGFTAVISRTIPEPKDDAEAKEDAITTVDDGLSPKVNEKAKAAAIKSANGTSIESTKKDIPSKPPTLPFTDTFLFTAHTSSIRCLAISPPKSAPLPPSTAISSPSVLLATGSADERINLYNLSTVPPAPSSIPKLPTLAGTSISENPRNRELGALLHHSSAVTCLAFPTRGKLLSAAGDNTIAITRTRDWTPLSTIRAPVPKAVGRPSGDTAAPGEVPAGVNDVAVHPSLKLMLSVGKGERCMRLWNLVTGKKAGVLNFSRELLAAAGEGRWGTGEGRRVEWDAAGEEFVVGFERGAVVFGMDSKPRTTLLPTPRTKLHQLRYLPPSTPSAPPILALSTEDGRILFYHTTPLTPTSSPSPPLEPSTTPSHPSKGKVPLDLPTLTPLATLGGALSGISGRIKDFIILSPFLNGPTLVVTGSSDGAVRVWGLKLGELEEAKEGAQVGTLLGAYETGSRITCLAGFVMDGSKEEEEGEEEWTAVGDEEESGDSESE